MNMIEWLTAFGCLFAVCGVGGMFVMDFLFDLVVHTEEGFKRLCRFTWWSLGLSALCLSAAFALFFWGGHLTPEAVI